MRAHVQKRTNNKFENVKESLDYPGLACVTKNSDISGLTALGQLAFLRCSVLAGGDRSYHCELCFSGKKSVRVWRSRCLIIPHRRANTALRWDQIYKCISTKHNDMRKPYFDILSILQARRQLKTFTKKRKRNHRTVKVLNRVHFKPTQPLLVLICICPAFGPV